MSVAVGILLLLIKVGSVIPILYAYPLNKAVLAGERMELRCETNYNETVNRWAAAQTGRKFEVVFKAKQQTDNSEKQRDVPVTNSNFSYFGVHFRQNGDCILYSNRTELKDAGIYTCFKNKDAIQRSAQLTVLESNPVCESNISAVNNNDFSKSSDVIIWMQCSISFSTVNNYPSMEWIQHHKYTESIRNDSVTITTTNSVTSALTVSINSTENGSYFSCKTFFKSLNGSIKTTASNVPDFRFIWNSPKVIFQESTLFTDKYPDDKDILMSSEGLMTTSVTTALSGGNNADSLSNYWFLVSLFLVAVTSIFFVLLAVVVLNFYICRKRTTTDGLAPVHALSFASLNHPISDEYEIIPYAYTDGYDKIEEAEDIIETDLDITMSPLPRREGPLPTPGYDRLLSQTSIPTIYSPIDNYEQPIDSEDIEIRPDHTSELEQCSGIDKTVPHGVNVNAKHSAYIQLISDTDKEDTYPTCSTVSMTRNDIYPSSISSSDSISEIPSSYLKIKDDSCEEIPSLS